MSKVIGIDLGTTNSVVACMEGGEPTVIPNSEGGRLTPSVVGFSKTGERMVGQVARRQAITNPDRTITSIKRQMGSNFRVRIDDKEYTPQEISAMILQKLKVDAEAYLGDKITKAVITVPAYFSVAQFQDGDVERPSPQVEHQYGMILTLIQAIGQGRRGGVFEVKATSGDTRLGGDDFDQRVIDWMAEDFQKNQGIDLRKDKVALQRLKEAAEKAKIELSSLTTTNINLPFITADQNGPKHLDMTLTRARFEEMTSDLVERTMGPTRRALSDAGLEPKNIDKVILVGGSTRIPAVQEACRRLLGKEPYKGINPDEVVALGAAIQAGVLSGDVDPKSVLLLDVTPLSLGIETLGGVFTKLIERNTTIPTRKSQIFSTAADGQTQVEIHVLQGEREMAAGNKTLGRFILDGIPPAPRGIPQIEVTFDIDVNGIAHVSAKDLGTGKEQKVTIKAQTSMSKNDIEQAVKEAEQYAAEDKKRREEAELRNAADSAAYNADKLLKDLGDKLDAGSQQKIRDAAEKVRDALKGQDLDRIKKAQEELTEVVYQVSSEVYAKSGAAGTDGQGQGGPEAGTGQEGRQEKVVDADYKVDTDQK